MAILLKIAVSQDTKWGWAMHSYFNSAAVEHLPAGMSFFKDRQTFLSDHAADPDRDDYPGYYHYIDIDNYPEFFNGTLPHEWDEITQLYSEGVLISNGTVPWVIKEWMGLFSSLMKDGDWENAWQVAAELGHYVADSHQPLHLTYNYNGQYTNNYGIHSRYETKLFYSYIDYVPDVKGTGIYWDNPLDSVFCYIEAIYPSVDLIMIADSKAVIIDPEYGANYYAKMWEELDSISIDIIHQTIINLASVWRTAWEDAGRPLPPGYHRTLAHVPGDYSTIQLAINAALDGDTVLVAPGTYQENIDFLGKNIVVASNYLLDNDTSFISATIIQDTSRSNVVTFQSQETSAAELCGLTIIGSPINIDGEGIFIRNASPTLSHLYITTGEDVLLKKPAIYGGSGGGIYFENSQSTIHDITLENNEAMSGGGLYALNSKLILTNIQVHRNFAAGGGFSNLAQGSGMSFVNSEVILQYSTIINNFTFGSIVEGFGLYANNSDLFLRNVTISGNHFFFSDNNTDNSFGGSIFLGYSSTCQIINSILWNNETAAEIYLSENCDSGAVTIAYSDIDGGANGIAVNSGKLFWLDGNISADPYFVDSLSGNYHLRQNSPCIDTGVQDTLIIYNNYSDSLSVPACEYSGLAPDMGALESSYPVSIISNNDFPSGFRLTQNYPNPFNPATTIEYAVPRTCFVRLEIFNMIGQTIETLVDDLQEPGHYAIDWDASRYSSGIYFYRLTAHNPTGGWAHDFLMVRRCIFIK